MLSPKSKKYCFSSGGVCPLDGKTLISMYLIEKSMIKKILVANRGEIAVRVMRSCREMEITSIAIFSEADRTAKHVLYADEAYCVGPAASKESYLNIEKIIEVAKAAHADSFIRTLPGGYNMELNEDASNVSQGQKQLLCITRVMLCLPPMLILDEATSSIDTRTEIKIQEAFARMMKGRTSFIVAHRLSTIREADIILVMRDGNIVEQGKHEELLEKNGFYAKLYNSQFAK